MNRGKLINWMLVVIGLCSSSLAYFYLLQNKFSSKTINQSAIPNEKVHLYSGDTLALAEIKFSKKLFLIIYSDECNLCQDIKGIICDMHKTEGFSFVMISDNQTIKRPLCNEKSNVFWGTMRFETIGNLSTNHSVPCVFIYDKHGKLEQKAFGGKSAEIIKKHIDAGI